MSSPSPIDRFRAAVDDVRQQVWDERDAVRRKKRDKVRHRCIRCRSTEQPLATIVFDSGGSAELCPRCLAAMPLGDEAQARRWMRGAE